ncbi:MAG: apolipoprotein N-acyltransferase [Deltaproteobacteria bacterium]|nr:apolipoprotein N-acyltransferase [Deltaproteobacteria bacterium]
MTPAAGPTPGIGPRALGAGAVAIIVAALAIARWSHVDATGFALGWVALVPWLAVLDRAPSWRATVLGGWAMSVAFVLAVFGWFAVAIAGYTGAPLWLSCAITALAAPLVQPQFLACALARRFAGERASAGRALAALCGASAYVAAEWAYPKLLGDTIGFGFWASPLLRQAADAIGPLGLTLVLVLANECALASLVALRRSPRSWSRIAAPLAVAACLVGVLALYGAVRIAQLAPEDGARPISVAAIQANLGDYRSLAAKRGTYGAVREVLDAHFALSDEALRAGAELVVWPETVYPTTFGAPKTADGAELDREIAGFVAERGFPLVFGAYDVDDEREYNAAILLERDGAGRTGFDAHRKARLFPFTEQVPALLDDDAVRAWLPWLGSWRPGSGASVLVVDGLGGVRVAPLVCYDAVDPALARRAVRGGAQILVTLSNDAWFATGDGPMQHFVVAAFRSIETRTPQVRATTTGVSAIVTATGETLAFAGVGERAALVARVVPSQSPVTLQLLWGDWFPPAILAASALALLVMRRAKSTSSTAALTR